MFLRNLQRFGAGKFAVESENYIRFRSRIFSDKSQHSCSETLSLGEINFQQNNDLVKPAAAELPTRGVAELTAGEDHISKEKTSYTTHLHNRLRWVYLQYSFKVSSISLVKHQPKAYQISLGRVQSFHIQLKIILSASTEFLAPPLPADFLLSKMYIAWLCTAQTINSGKN